MKKIFITLAFLFTMMFCMTSNVSAESYSGLCGYDLNWSLNTDTGVLHITGTGDMVDYNQNCAPWYSYRNNITTVVVDNGCTHIGKWAFGFLPELTTVTLPNSVTTLADNSFAYSGKLVNCPLPDYLTSIGEWAFAECGSLQGLDLPNTLEYIGPSAFRKCYSITDAHIPGGVTTLYHGTFINCKKLTNVTFGEGVTNLETSVFAETNILTLNIPSTVYKIDQSCFENCKNLSAVIMMGCEIIERSAFNGCANLRKVVFAPNTRIIEALAFGYCNSLLSVRLPESVTEIGYNAFAWHKSSGYPVLEQVIILNPNCVINNIDYIGRPGVCTVYGEKGSTAHTFAINQGYAFELIGNEKPEPSIFKDVSTDSFYAEPVEWAVNNGITSGITPVTFEPNADCTRGQVVTFLWRSAGQPEPKTTTCTFTDVRKDAYYYKAVLWAVENDITTGLNASTFGPGKSCTRSQVVTFLWRSMNRPETTATACTFTDVKKDSYYYQPVLWAVENKITTGLNASTFAPNDTCTRGQIVTFIWRSAV